MEPEPKQRNNYTSSVSISVNGEDTMDGGQPPATAAPRRGVDNPGFDAEKADVRPNGVSISLPDDHLNGSMTSTATESSGSATPKKEAVAEAVNLELVNMNPFSASEKAAMEEAAANGHSNGHSNGHGNGHAPAGNGIPIKKDAAEDADLRDPYDEYFVPVNEHRKYMR